MSQDAIRVQKITGQIAAELAVGAAQVAAAVELLAEGATVPFIARYRKEKTGGLDDTQLRKLEERLGYLNELEDRRAAGGGGLAMGLPGGMVVRTQGPEHLH